MALTLKSRLHLEENGRPKSAYCGIKWRSPLQLSGHHVQSLEMCLQGAKDLYWGHAIGKRAG